MRTVVYRFPDLLQVERMLEGAAAFELGLPSHETVDDGEWILAIFELGPRRRATAVAARGAVNSQGARLVFEERDWQRLVEFVGVEARRPSLMMMAPVAAPGPVVGPRATIAGVGDVERALFEATSSVTTLASAAPVDASPPPAPVFPTPLSAPPPLAPRPGTGAPATGPPAAPGAGSSQAPAVVGKILVVDDDEEQRDVVAAMLEAVGLEVESRATAEDALRALDGGAFSLVLVDATLPGMSGLDLCRTLRKSERHARLPLLVLSQAASSQGMVDAFASGADDYVAKPFRAPELGARIFGLLRRARIT